jgi:hypothetical protein
MKMDGYKSNLSFLDNVLFDTTNFERLGSIVIYSLIGFFLPFFLSHLYQQIIVGSIINMMIILSAFHLKKWEAMPLMLLPSLGVITAGVLFGSFTLSLIYIMPFIWIGNFVLFAGVKKFYIEKKMNYSFSLPIAAIAKAALLFVAAFVLVRFGVIPAAFLIAMGLIQILTALIGGTLAFGFMKARKMVN